MSSKEAITPDHFDLFLAWLQPLAPAGDVGTAYEAARLRLVMFFEGRRCHEAETLADRVLDRACQKVVEQAAGDNPLPYLIGVARNVYHESVRDQVKQAQRDIDFATVPLPSPQEVENEHYCLDRCMAALPTQDRTLLLAYFQESKHAKIELRKQLAAQFGISQGALRNRIFRLNQEIAPCVTKCLEKF